MTVTELRNALQELEAQGHGNLPAVVVAEGHVRYTLRAAKPYLKQADAGLESREFPRGTQLVMLL